MVESLHFLPAYVRTGIDIVYIEDLRPLLEGANGLVLTEGEWQEVQHSPNCLERVAGKFACKEAVLKALGCGLGDIDLVDIEISNEPSGQPSVHLHGTALGPWRRTGCHSLAVSVSHYREYSVAVAVAT